MTTELFGMPLEQMDLSSVVKLPPLEQQYGSLSPLEKMQIGLLLMACQPKVIVETGVWRGRTTRFMAEFLSLNGIHGIVNAFDLPEILDELKSGDPWFTSAKNVTLRPGSLPHSLNNWLASNDQPIDFALVDATHDFNAVYAELNLIAARLNPRGYIVCHDYGGPGSKYEGVMCAVNEVAWKYRMVVLPLWSSENAETAHFCQAAILHKEVTCPPPRRWFYWRRYHAKKYPRIAALWGRIRSVLFFGH
jgi:hypothetical protein